MRWTEEQLKWIQENRGVIDQGDFLVIMDEFDIESPQNLCTYEIAILKLALAKLCNEEMEIYLYGHNRVGIRTREEYDFPLDYIYLSPSLRLSISKYTDKKLKNWLLKEYLESGSINSSEKEFMKEILEKAIIDRDSFGEGSEID